LVRAAASFSISCLRALEICDAITLETATKVSCNCPCVYPYSNYLKFREEKKTVGGGGEGEGEPANRNLGGIRYIERGRNR